MLTTRLIRASLVAGALSTSAVAQRSITPTDSSGLTRSPLGARSAFTISATQMRPRGELGTHMGLGYGIGGVYLFRLDLAGVLSIRIDASAVDYGNESRRTAFSNTVGGRVQVDVSTINYAVPFSIGPQLTWPTGPVRPYVTGGIGGSGFFTESRVEGTSDHATIASHMNQSDFAPSWTTGGGVYVPLTGGRSPLMLDLGMQYVGGGNARYLVPGSIRDFPNGEIAISPTESHTHLMLVHIGVRIGR